MGVIDSFQVGLSGRMKFEDSLNSMTLGDAVMCLAAGHVAFSLDDAPESTRWYWFADLLDSDWGLTGRLKPILSTAVTVELHRVAGMCRVSGQCTVSAQAWTAVRHSTEELSEAQSVRSVEALRLALSAANDIALDAIDNVTPEFSVAVSLAFEALASTPTADWKTATAWIVTAIGEWKSRTFFGI
ncbi:hypothetical protein [Rhodococcus erythropolis]|uniref:Uncharacterized protein n=1 Tax=Rhodococcus erythropolis TaxID=1833 RepID=A0AAX3ZZL6_RHOER|nr:hypothetical protein [Rhodococcus erythropolis]WMN01895.1 hypothetical protein QIE55_31845 [Rhodococcus erythropolis]WMN03181.1 hypothetical protein QIE55_32790 [Rhodococcus erythropolis]